MCPSKIIAFNVVVDIMCIYVSIVYIRVGQKCKSPSFCYGYIKYWPILADRTGGGRATSNSPPPKLSTQSEKECIRYMLHITLTPRTCRSRDVVYVLCLAAYQKFQRSAIVCLNNSCFTILWNTDHKTELIEDLFLAIWQRLACLWS